MSKERKVVKEQRKNGAVLVEQDVVGVADDKMAQIRELMFGGVARDIDRRLQDLSQRLDDEVARLAAEQDKRLSALEERLVPQLEKLAAQLRQESTARAAALDDAEARFSQSLRTQRDETQARLQQQEEEVAAAETRLRELCAKQEADMQAALQTIKQALASARQELGTEKVARADLADVLAELSLRLRTGEISLSP